MNTDTLYSWAIIINYLFRIVIVAGERGTHDFILVTVKAFIIE